MQKEISEIVGLGMIIGFGPALILKALVNAGKEERAHENQVEIVNAEERARQREIAIETKHMVQDNKNKSEIEALRLKIEVLEQDKERLNKKVKHLEAESEMKSDIIAEKNQGKKFDHLVGLMK